MMKRMRTLDVPKFRRPLKNRASSYSLIYLKFILMWLGCIALDFVIGFRFELLWPVWLLIRHLYESFRVHAFSSSLHYSAFSVFFVCVTATSDLVCYLFIPIQVLLFLASTYVWMQFVYQSTERGICVPSLVLWTVFLMFEYSMRYRFENATWYLTRSSWITAGLFPSNADNVPIGSASNSTSPSLSPRFELYRPFAAHCIGFPVVTLGFRVKSFFSKWRMRVRREEVMRQNEFFERLLVDAVPESFDNRHHFISSPRRYLMLEQDALDHDFGSTFPDNSLDGSVTGASSRLYTLVSSSYSSGSCAPLAICNSGNAITSQSVVATSGGGSCQAGLSRRVAQKAFPRSLGSGQRQQQNGQFFASASSATSGISQAGVMQKRNGTFGASQSSRTNLMSAGSEKSKEVHHQSSMISHSFLYKLWRILIVARLLQLLAALAFSAFSFLYERLICPISAIAKNAIFGAIDDSSAFAADVAADYIGGEASERKGGAAASLFNLMDLNSCHSGSPTQNGGHQQQDDLISSSGDGSSHVGCLDDCESDKEETSSVVNQQQTSQIVNNSPAAVSANVNSAMAFAPAASTVMTAGSKKKSRRARGRTPNDEIVYNGVNQSNQFVQSGGRTTSATTTTGTNMATEAKSSLATTCGSAAPTAAVCNGHNYHSGNDNYPLCNGNNTEMEQNSVSMRDVHSNAAKNAELRQLTKEKELLESRVEKLNSELKTMRCDVHELRTQLSQAQQNERIYKNELVQCRTKFDQLESRHKQLAKQSDQSKVQTANYEKRINDLQARKAELEHELANEHRLAASASSVKEKQQQNRSRVSDLERELKGLRREMRSKDEEHEKLTAELYQMRLTNFNKQTEEKSLWDRVRVLMERNTFLEETLSSENRLKMDLFSALNNSKAEIEMLNKRLQNWEKTANENGSSNNGEITVATATNGNLHMGFMADDFMQFSSGTYDGNHGGLVHSSGSLNHFSSVLNNVTTQRQNSSPLSLSGDGGLQTASTPKSPIAVANLDQLMQATGAQHMSYSFAPFDATEGGTTTADSAKTYDKAANGLETVSTNLANGGAVGSSRKTSTAKSAAGNKKTIGAHRSNGGDTAANNGDSKNSSNKAASDTKTASQISHNINNPSPSPQPQQQQTHKAQHNNNSEPKHQKVAATATKAN